MVTSLPMHSLPLLSSLLSDREYTNKDLAIVFQPTLREGCWKYKFIRIYFRLRTLMSNRIKIKVTITSLPTFINFKSPTACQTEPLNTKFNLTLPVLKQCKTAWHWFIHWSRSYLSFVEHAVFVVWHRFENNITVDTCLEQTVNQVYLRNRRWGGCVYVLQMFFSYFSLLIYCWCLVLHVCVFYVLL